jgi:hypothetical protein
LDGGSGQVWDILDGLLRDPSMCFCCLEELAESRVEEEGRVSRGRGVCGSVGGGSAEWA